MGAIDFLRGVVDRILLIEDEPHLTDEPVDDYEMHPDDYDSPTDRFATISRPEEPGRIHVLRQDRAGFAGMPMVLSRPKNMDDAKLVGERVRDRVPVVMNLEGTDDTMSQRIVDFVGGVVFALQGSISRAGRAVYICSPADIPVEDLKSEPEQAPTSLFEMGEEPQRMAR